MLAIYSLYSASDIGTITIEGTTNSPTDYDTLSSDEFTGSDITDSSKYYSTIDYATLTQSNTDSTQSTCLLMSYALGFNESS